MLTADIPPNQSIYIKNINEKIKKEELKRSLYCLFSHFGRILDVVALKTPKLRGQAWVVFTQVTAASNAVLQMQNFPFYDTFSSLMFQRIQYAKSKSDYVTKAQGTFVPKEKKMKQEDKVERKRHAEETQQPSMPNGATTQNGMPVPPFQPSGQDTMPPNNILFIHNLPIEMTSMMLQLLFEQYTGFKEIRMIEAKPGIAFVEYEDDVQSSMAMQALQGFKITPQNPMVVSFAKK
ncbi:LOW QUALITY PROTEIN: U2 small nuclear ribonucleoprotein B'' 2 [Arabidopsis lyrata subsp. lyrata]|uniref:LOW QUALITY PROTEIN: U2 small nuclear ribonucleoprotein B'' 2 n=1 Tax=Arabidopsis lyrata subsp. lyrata TaxID=81972 RepID=UPI000A29A43E|nr:LOW QUALITY PROTEIN: U2 small nuclear ribonucleoprotein B'' 2 [Arabidopsis lyrata subsp. lyrata]|eukprot:XP_002889626.2 LOW QUALITY PROTEIN: U2 small nuclear ribonucleoprotein B'' 2 [Arabidopsis lyrata subsp. lyrata]